MVGDKSDPAVVKACLLAIKAFLLAFLIPVPSTASVALSSLLVLTRAGSVVFLRVVAVSRVVLVALAKSLGIP